MPKGKPKLTKRNQCLTLSLLLKGKVYFPDSPSYVASLGSYFSLQETAVHPVCVVSPKTAQDVSVAVRALTTTTHSSNSGCQFAIRSGGHAAFAGAANIQGGVTIDLTALDSIVLGQGTDPIASVSVGATWGEIYSHLDPLNLSVNGARAAGVGVGGLVTGGGISYFGPRFGWTCDTVNNFEVVLANGSIIHANGRENPDLMWALRGGQNNFGIVTRVDLQTFQQGNLWGGYVIYDASTTDTQIAALATFNDPKTYDELSSLITTFAYSGAQGVSVVVNNMEYTKPVANPPAFQQLSTIPSMASTQRITNMTDLVTETEMSHHIGLRQASATVTIESTVEAINATVRAWNASLPSVQKIPSIVWAVVMDPLPPALYTRHAEANALGLTDRHGRTLIVVQLVMTWLAAKDDEAIDVAARGLIAAIQRDVGKLGGLDPFLYVNYAAPWQRPMASYGGGSVERLRKVKRKYDPRGVFTSLVPGGFKL